MLTVDHLGELIRTVEYQYKTKNGTLKDRIEYLVAEAVKPVRQKPMLDDEGTQILDDNGKPKMHGETVAEWVTRVTNGAKLFKRDGIELNAQEAIERYDDMGGLVNAIFRAIQENEAKN